MNSTAQYTTFPLNTLEKELTTTLLAMPSEYNSASYTWRCREIHRIAPMLLGDTTPLPAWICEEFNMDPGSRFCQLATLALTRFA